MHILHILVDFENTQPSAADVALVQGAHLRLWIFRGPSQKKYDAEFTEALLLLGDRVRVVKCEKSGRNALDMHIAFQLGRLVGELTAAAEARTSDRPAFVVVSRDTDYEPLLQYLRVQGFSAQRATGIKAALGGAAVKAGGPKASAAMAPDARAARTKAAPAPVLAKAPAARKSRPAKAAVAAPEPAEATPAPKPAKAGRRGGAARTAAKTTAAPPSAAPSTAGTAEMARTVIEHFLGHPKSRPAKLGGLEKWLASHLRGKLTQDTLHALVAELERQGVVRLDGRKVLYPLWV
jgi:hypothetical protein